MKIDKARIAEPGHGFKGRYTYGQWKLKSAKAYLRCFGHQKSVYYQYSRLIHRLRVLLKQHNLKEKP